MNGTADTANVLSGWFDALQRVLHERRLMQNQAKLQMVSNNLGVYFLFCLFGLAVLGLFLWSSMRARQTSLSFFVLRRQVWQVCVYTGGDNSTKAVWAVL